MKFIFLLLVRILLTISVIFSCRLPEDLEKKPEESLILLKSSGAEPKEINFTENGKKIYGVSTGCTSEKNKIIIFIHGSPGGWQNYFWYLGNYALNSSFCILSLDRPGFGKSESSQAVPDVEKQAVILENTIANFRSKFDFSGKKKILLVGHSYGGPIAAKIASNPSNGIAGLLLLAASLSSEEEEIQWYNRIADWGWVKDLLPQEVTNSNEEMLPLKSQLRTLEPFWKTIRCKTILIHGVKDSLVPFANLKYFKTQLSPSILTTISLEEEDHFIPWTQKPLIEKTLLNFF
ncbi:alpha/beta hydrolase family protein [Leptospira sp. WS92.C1]